jgi:hypothetical protein
MKLLGLKLLYEISRYGYMKLLGLILSEVGCRRRLTPTHPLARRRRAHRRSEYNKFN